MAKQIALRVTTDYFQRHSWTMQRKAENNICEPRANLRLYKQITTIISDGARIGMKTALLSRSECAYSRNNKQGCDVHYEKIVAHVKEMSTISTILEIAC